MFGDLGIYNLLVVCQYARRGLFFTKKNTLGEKVTYISSENSKTSLFSIKNRHILPFARFAINHPVQHKRHLQLT